MLRINFLKHISFRFSIPNGSAKLLFNDNRYNGGIINYSDELIDIPENKMAVVTCSKGFILSDPRKRNLSCQQGTWNFFFNESVHVSNQRYKNRQERLPECKRIICRKFPRVLNAQALTRVSIIQSLPNYTQLPERIIQLCACRDSKNIIIYNKLYFSRNPMCTTRAQNSRVCQDFSFLW